MRRRLATAVPAALVTTLLVMATALAGHGHATGGGEFFYLATQKLQFEAHDFGAPEDDRGTAHYRNLDADVEYTAEIVCAFVTSDTVRFGYFIPENEPGLAGTPIVWEVTDGGSPGDGNDTAAFIVANPYTCDTTTVPPGGTVLNGNFTVHDG